MGWWFKLHGGNLKASTNNYDRYQGADGRAMVYQNERNIEGFFQPWVGPERKFKSTPIPEGSGNVQKIRIFPEGVDVWVAYLWMDPRDGQRCEQGLALEFE